MNRAGNKKPEPEMRPAAPEEQDVKPELSHTLNEFKDCADLVHQSLPDKGVHFIFIGHLIGLEAFAREITVPFENASPDDIAQVLGRSQYREIGDSKTLIKDILDGSVAIFHDGRAYAINLCKPETRSIQQSETEAVINGPHDSFNESAITNLSLIRRRVKSAQLKIARLEVGEVTKTEVYVLYIVGIANMEYVNEMSRRIQNIEVDAVHDGNMLVQIIDDQPNSVFPLFPTTERVDSAVSRLTAGRILVVMDGSPSVISAPASFFEFFSSPDDYYQRWMLGTGLRILRFAALIVTITFTALYVAVTTFHYEMIPEDLLLTLTESRSKVPFPPIYEALLMELTIELLREAGARLPTKIGQTIGIVGGIVIGQAAVQAGLTSNILIIAVASSAIASFVIPSYVMSASIRLIRFGLIIMSGMLGVLGLMMSLALIIIHLSGLTSLKSSYLTPVAPNKLSDWKDIFVRAPFWMLRTRPTQSKSPNKVKNKMRE
ncbi:spore germination protein [Paenibacillus sp. IB182493]|uniref:Spore germination protein n=2 Tax=Paenibacillus arenilitoris TaxID=2772299 RepID=A0A927H476_9BACL|nr:spore germination protein [Paenibacillus arenilitoris]